MIDGEGRLQAKAEGPVTKDTRQRMVEAAARLLQQGGTSAASFTDVLSASGAARGAIYHHFPNGKTELTREAVAWTGRRVQMNLSTLSATTAVEVVSAFLDTVRPVVADAALGSSCAVAAVIMETGRVDASLTQTAQAALQSWTDALDARLIEAGAAPAAAHAVAVVLITLLEGTQILCRAAGDLTPFDAAAASVHAAARVLLASPSQA